MHMTQGCVNGLAVWRAEGDGEPILCVHGGPDFGSGYLRAHLPRALPSDRPLIVPDLRGAGRSRDFEEEGESMDVLVADLVGILDVFGTERAVVLGHSFGGLVGQRLAIEHPERASALILVDPDPPLRVQWEAAFGILEGRTARMPGGQQKQKGGFSMDSRDAREKHIRLRLQPYFHDPSDAERLVLDIPAHRLERFGELGARIRDALGSWDFRPGLSRFQEPALVVTGPASVFPPEGDGLEPALDAAARSVGADGA